jgi:hypothetical protein
MIFVSILTSIGLYIGVPYFILLGIITGILFNSIYRILVAGILTILSSLTGTPDLSIILGVIGVNIVVQNNNILVPLIINTKFK